MLSVTIRTRFTPGVTVTPGIGGGGTGQGGGFLGELLARVVQPEVESGPLVYAPYGRPGNQWMVAAGAAVVVIAAVMWRVLRK